MLTKKGFSAFSMLTLAVCVGGAVIVFFPLFWMALTSLKTPPEIMKVPLSFFPKNFLNFNNYWRITLEEPIGWSMINSIIISSIAVLSSLLLSSLAGFGFAKFNFYGKNVLFFAIIALLMVPFQSIVVPLYLWVNRFGLINTYPGIVLPFLVSAFGVFLMRESIAEIPDDYIDAATIDGCSYLGIFFRIILPNVKPALVALAIIKFMWTWNEFLWPLVTTSSERMKVVTVALMGFKDMHFTRFELVTAGATVSILPLAIVFIILQKHVVKAIATSGLKG